MDSLENVLHSVLHHGDRLDELQLGFGFHKDGGIGGGDKIPFGGRHHGVDAVGDHVGDDSSRPVDDEEPVKSRDLPVRKIVDVILNGRVGFEEEIVLGNVREARDQVAAQLALAFHHVLFLAVQCHGTDDDGDNED